jgi:hypothetical protein
MNRITIWYAKLDRRKKTAFLSAGIAVAALVVVLIAYMALVPEKVQVRYGTVVRDPIDGHVWSDDTQTIWVNPSEAGNYKVTYVDQYSEEHQAQIAAQEAEKQQKQEALAKYPGIQAMGSFIPQQQMEDMETLQSNIEVMKDQVTYSLEMISQLNQILESLTDFRNTLAGMSVPPEMAPVIQQVISGLDKYIAAGNLLLKAVETGDPNSVKQASDLLQEASAIFMDISVKYQDVWQEILNLLQNFNLTFQQ